jgi:predicted ArsR family transcriptional regulator
MGSRPWDRRPTASTRGQILALLRRAGRTVEELAEALGMTENGVRAQLAILERDGLVEQRGARRRGRKPASIYRPTAQAERLFPKAFETVLGHLLDVLDTEGNPTRREELLRAVGRRMAAEQPRPGGDLPTRLSAVAATLTEMGGLYEIEQHEDGFSICGYSCPLAPVPRSHRELCTVLETMLTELVGVPVHQRCERGDSLWCWFDVPRQPVES